MTTNLFVDALLLVMDVLIRGHRHNTALICAQLHGRSLADWHYESMRAATGQ